MNGWLTGALARNECDPLLDPAWSTLVSRPSAFMVSQPFNCSPCLLTGAQRLTPNRSLCVDWWVNWRTVSLEIASTCICQSLRLLAVRLCLRSSFRRYQPRGCAACDLRTRSANGPQGGQDVSRGVRTPVQHVLRSKKCRMSDTNQHQPGQQPRRSYMMLSWQHIDPAGLV